MNDSPPAEFARTESDSLGSVDITGARNPIGINTVRGVQNFELGSPTVGAYPSFVDALLKVKLAAARANVQVGALDSVIGSAIEAACLTHPRSTDFPVEILEGSGGTSTNMNVNEVIANRALQHLGHEMGAYAIVHPNDHVNLGQSTNDVIPTALKLAVHAGCAEVSARLRDMADAWTTHADTFASVLRTGRTCLQAAQPMTLGQAFGGYASAINRCAAELDQRAQHLLVVPLGATAIGTGLGAAPGFRAAVIHHLGDITGLAVAAPDDFFDGSQNADALARVSAELRTTADVMAKIATDVVLLSSAPSGDAEITIPAVQAGSSIMPGKVNPVMAMMVQQVAYRVFGNDASVSLATQHGQLEINHFEPLMAQSLLESTSLLTNAARLFTSQCIVGIGVNAERSLENLLASPAISTAFVPQLGYEKTSALVKQSIAENRPFIDVVIDEGLLDRSGVTELLLRTTMGPDT